MIPFCLKIKLKWFPLVKFCVGHLRSLLPFQPNAYFTSHRNTEKFLFWITMHAVRRDCLWLVAGFRCAVSDWSIGFKGGSGGVRLSQALISALRVRGSIHSLFYYCLRCDSTLAGISPCVTSDGFYAHATPSGFPNSRGHRGSGQSLLPWLWD